MLPQLASGKNASQDPRIQSPDPLKTRANLPGNSFQHKTGLF